MKNILPVSVIKTLTFYALYYNTTLFRRKLYEGRST